MNLRDLKYLVILADTLHFGRAAELCHISQPTLSMQIKKLEDTLGVPLFERTNKRVILTEYGREIVQMARAITQRSSELMDFAKSCRDPLAGEFQLGAFPTIAPYLLPHIIPAIKEAMPKLRMLLLEEKSPVLLERLHAGALDAAILALPVTMDNLLSQPLFDDIFRLAVPKDHWLAHHKTVDMKDIANEKLLLLEDGHCLRDQALQLCQLSGAKEMEGFRATSLETLRQMVAAGSGITLIPEIAIPSPTGKLIRYIPFMGHAPSRTIAIVYRQSSTRKKAVETIAAIIKNIF